MSSANFYYNAQYILSSGWHKLYNRAWQRLEMGYGKARRVYGGRLSLYGRYYSDIKGDSHQYMEGASVLFFDFLFQVLY